MKKFTSVILSLIFLLSLVSCRKNINDSSSSLSTLENHYVSSTFTDSTGGTVTNQSSLQDNIYQSTVEKPNEVYFYQKGKYGVSSNVNLNYQIVKEVESWYANYTTDNIPYTNYAINNNELHEIFLNETVIEIRYDQLTQINMLGKVDVGKFSRILIPLTGKYAYYIFRGRDDYNYHGGQYTLDGSGLEKYFKNISLDKTVRSWESTVIAPVKVTFYKDGKQSVSTDKAFNHQIAKHIESWFKYSTDLCIFNGITTTADITSYKFNNTAILLEFDQEFTFYDDFTHNDTKLFIMLDGKFPNTVFTSDDYYDSNWSNMSPGNPYCENNLEQFFKDRQYEQIETAERWQSTVRPPWLVQLYKNGNILQESTDNDFNLKVAQQVESWYLYQENIKFEDLENIDKLISNVRKNETYIEISFNSEIKFYNNAVVDENTRSLLIPLTGECAYIVFTADNSYNYTRVLLSQGTSELSNLFDSLKNN